MSEATLTKAIMKTWSANSRQPRFIVAVQVNNGAGFSYNRTIDAVVFDTWPSGGLHLHGLEIKSTKADLRRELQNTEKFAGFAQHLDQFSIVAPRGVVDIKLLPPKWGLYVEIDDGTVRARRKPLMLHDEGRRLTINRSLAAAFARALVTRSLSNEAKVAEFKRGQEHGKNEMKRDIKHSQRELDVFVEAIENFETASGIKIDRWKGGQMGEAVRLIVDGGIAGKIRYAPNLRKLGEELLKLAGELDRLKEMLDG